MRAVKGVPVQIDRPSQGRCWQAAASWPVGWCNESQRSGSHTSVLMSIILNG